MLYKTVILIQSQEDDPSSLHEQPMVLDLTQIAYIQGYMDTDADVPPHKRRNCFVRLINEEGFPIKDTVEEILPYWLRATGKELAISPSTQQHKDISI